MRVAMLMTRLASPSSRAGSWLHNPKWPGWAAACGAVVPPLAVFVFVRLLLILTAVSVQRQPFAPTTWMQWDSQHYLDIAVSGYALYSCPWEPSTWCGNAGWFPVYPWLIRLLTTAGVQPEQAGLALAMAFSFGLLFLLWNGFLRQESGRLRFFALWAAGVFPGFIYFHAYFPMGLVALMLLTWIKAVEIGSRPLAIAAAAVATASYPTAVLLAPAALLAAAATVRAEDRRTRSTLWWSAVGAVCGTLFIWVWLRVAVGHWDAWLLAQSERNYPPGWTWARIKVMLWTPIVYRPTSWTRIAVFAQGASVAALVIGLVIQAVRHRRFDGIRQPMVLICAICFWLGPHISGYRNSYYRSESLLLPSIVLFPTLPRILQILLALVWTVLAPLMVWQFLIGRLV